MFQYFDKYIYILLTSFWRNGVFMRRATSTFTSRGRGTYGTGLALVVRFGAAWASLVARWRRGTLHGRGGAWRHPPSLCVAGVALGDIHRRGRRGTWSHPQVKLRGSFGTCSHRPTFCMLNLCAYLKERVWMRCCTCCSHVWPYLTCTQCLAALATSSLGYLCMVWLLWLNVGRALVHIC